MVCLALKSKRRLEAELGCIRDTTPTNTLGSLIDHGLMVKVAGEYMVTNSILHRAVMRIYNEIFFLGGFVSFNCLCGVSYEGFDDFAEDFRYWWCGSACFQFDW